ncbi:HlyU family transcriptional regulator [Methyloraptor flagellatus]|uniref:HlyU family transcriptional regulator n=1 Tax=Methyloraptor flagellatus TaxID=3162530 RepID=A0AAU7XAV8_9HYPH
MSFLKKLFGLGPSAPAAPEKLETEEYREFLVTATPIKEGREWQVCGVISREENGEMREHRFIRVDRFPDKETAVQMIFQKGRQIIDERRGKVFD